eukprot:CAMPEP_0197907864 /NCGR_PEP_ID=MMETSP1439-20131203/65668_1 /TAXON_ID=66791 /ORGANISM="Gonyaulax spinifera, Strain CCMP409" /LENGTH=213 /DNA_ID=CAMNT_0043529321 /DNA_START=90 /DNA_END=728 /DNA_ORIENTATION=+
MPTPSGHSGMVSAPTSPWAQYGRRVVHGRHRRALWQRGHGGDEGSISVDSRAEQAGDSRGRGHGDCGFRVCLGLPAAPLPGAPALRRGPARHRWQPHCRLRSSLLPVDVVQRREYHAVVPHRLVLRGLATEARGARTEPERRRAPGESRPRLVLHGPTPESGGANAALQGVHLLRGPHHVAVSRGFGREAARHVGRRKCRGLQAPRALGRQLE